MAHPPATPRAKRKGKRPDRRRGQVAAISYIDEAFAREWMKNGMNAKAAYAKTHPNATPATAKAEGPKVLTKPTVQNWLSARLVSKFEQSQQREELTAERVVEEIRRLAIGKRAPVGEDGKILPIKDWPEDLTSLIEGWTLDDDGNIKTVKLAGKGRGVELAAKYHNLIVERSENVNLNLDVGSMTTEQIRKRLEALTAEHEDEE